MNGRDVQAAMLAYLKSKPIVTSLLANNSQVKELQWQGDEFLYPAIRISVDFYPSLPPCNPEKAEVYIDVFSEQKSSNEASLIAAALKDLLHEHPFTYNGVKFPVVVVEKVNRPERSIYAWQSTVKVMTKVN